MITTFLKWMNINVDKVCHFYIGWALMAMLVPFLGIGALGIVAVIAMLKETGDTLFKTGTTDVWDFAATCFGGLAGYGAWLALVAITGYTATFHIPFTS